MLILLGILAAMFVLMAAATFISNRFFKKETPKAEEQPVEIPMDCCGAHEVCEFEEMLQNPTEIVYFEDEELDRYQGVPADRYEDAQIEEFRDVLYTLKGDEIRMWLLSIERRKVQLPNILRQEAFQLIAES